MPEPRRHRVPRPQPAPELRRVPLYDIDPKALRRDRLHLDAEAMAELTSSIAANGLRAPTELYTISEGRHFGLISGFRRFTAFQRLLEETQLPTYSAIPAFVRDMKDGRERLAAMIEENEVREPLSPWEQGAAILSAVEQGFFDTLDDAARGLHAHASRFKRMRILKIARAVEALGPKMKHPHTLSLRKCLRLAEAVEAGFGEVIGVALDGCETPLPDLRWERIEPYLREAEALPAEKKPIGRKPIRVMEMKPGIMLRREKTQDGWAIHMHGKRVTEGDVEQAFLTLQIVFGEG